MTPTPGSFSRRLLALALLGLFTAPMTQAQTATPTATRTPTRTPTSTRTPRPPTPTRTPTATATPRTFTGQHDLIGGRLRWRDGSLYILRQDGSYDLALQVTLTPTPTPTP
jgi:hypothetical protein